MGSASIGCVIRGNPTFKEMLNFVYGVWNRVETPRIFLHNDGHFIFRSKDKMTITKKGPSTLDTRSMIIRGWVPDFQVRKEPVRVVPLWMQLPDLYNIGQISTLLLAVSMKKDELGVLWVHSY